MEELELDKVYDLTLKPNSILGNIYNGATFQGTVSLTKIKDSINPNIESIITSLKNVDNIDTISKKYYLFYVNNTSLVINEDWISSFSSNDVRLTLRFDNISLDEKQLILNTLKDIGFYSDRLTII